MPRYTQENTAGQIVRVWLDGEELPQTGIVEADTAEGYVVRCVRNAEGQFLTRRLSGGGSDFVTEKVHGVVAVQCLPLAAGAQAWAH